MKLSIVTITYRDPIGLEKTLRSLEPLWKSDFEWEHVIVDSSPDQNDPILKRLPDTWPIVRICEQPRGIYAAMNAGIARARGEWIWFLNGGDRLYDVEALKRCLGEIAGDDGAAVDLVCAGVALYRNGEYQYDHLPERSFEDLILTRPHHVPHQGMLYRHEAWRKVGPFSEKYRIAADYEHHLRCFLAGLRVKTLALALAAYDLGGASEDYRRSLDESREIARGLRDDLGMAGYLRLRMGIFAEGCRLEVVKRAGRSPIGRWLRPVWIWWNRRGSGYKDRELR